MSKYNNAYKDKDLPAITFDKGIKIVLPKLTNRDKKQIKQETGVDLMQKFMEMQSAGGSTSIPPAVDKIFEDVSDEAKEELHLPKIKQQLSSLVDTDDSPMEKIFDDIGVEVEHILFKKSLEHDDSDINNETVDKIVADLETLEYVRALMWLITGRDMGEDEAEELADKVDGSGNSSTTSKTEL